MANVIIEELDNSSDDDYASAKALSDAENDDEAFHACEEGPGLVSNAHDSSARTATVESGHSEEALIAQGEAAVTDDDAMTDAELEELNQADELKLEGNTLYGSGQYQEALEKYRKALELAPEKAGQKRAVLFANSAAALLKLERFAEAAKDCSAALALEPPTSLQIKALTRRSSAYEKLDDLERALADHEKLLELDSQNASSQAAVRRLKPVVDERREKMKDEMIDKLKDLGNTVLGKFGMSLDNFKAEKDPQTGSYSINFKQ